MKIQGMLIDKTTESPQVALQYRCDLQSGRRTPGTQNVTWHTERALRVARVEFGDEDKHLSNFCLNLLVTVCVFF